MHKHMGQFDPEWRCWTVFGRRSHSGVPGAGPASGVDAAGFGRVAAASVSIVVVDEPSSIKSMMGHSGFAMVVGAAEQRRLKQRISDTRSRGALREGDSGDRVKIQKSKSAVFILASVQMCKVHYGISQ